LQEVVRLRNDSEYIAEQDNSFKNIECKNVELQFYIQSLEERDTCKHCDASFKNRGSAYNSLSYTQKQRKLKDLKANAEKALWFLESFGLKLDKLSLMEL
jgi:hypothetical protein